MATRRAQNISEAKLRQLLEYNQRLREQLDVTRITVSEASTGLIEYCKTTKILCCLQYGVPLTRKKSFCPYQ
ncbi:unnamed protein product [Absidia cylindrospora]